MFFTREDILKIQNALLQLSVKDSELPSAEPVTYDDTLSIVQDGKNKQIKIEDFFNQISLWKREDFINITDKYDEHYISLIEAIDLVPILQRKDGLVITFQDIEGNWEIYQFRGNITEFFNIEKWFNLYDYRNNIIQSIVPDEEDLTVSIPNENGNSLVSLKDRVYDPTSFSGKGYKILRKNIKKFDIPTVSIIVSHAPTSSGDITITVNDKVTTINLDSTTDTTPAIVATKITAALKSSLDDYDVSVSSNRITLTRHNDSSVSPSSINVGSTSAIISVTDSVNKNVYKNVLTQEMINEPNTVYEIRYNYDLNGQKITIRNECVLKFTGGSLKGGKLETNNVYIKGFPKLYVDVKNLGNDKIYIDWFMENQDVDISTIINKLFIYNDCIVLSNKTYNVNNTINIINEKKQLLGSSYFSTSIKVLAKVGFHIEYSARYINISNIDIIGNATNCAFDFSTKERRKSLHFITLQNLYIRNFDIGISSSYNPELISPTLWNCKFEDLRIEICNKCLSFTNKNNVGKHFGNVFKRVLLLGAKENLIDISENININFESCNFGINNINDISIENYDAYIKFQDCNLEEDTNTILNSTEKSSVINIVGAFIKFELCTFVHRDTNQNHMLKINNGNGIDISYCKYSGNKNNFWGYIIMNRANSIMLLNNIIPSFETYSDNDLNRYTLNLNSPLPKVNILSNTDFYKKVNLIYDTNSKSVVFIQDDGKIRYLESNLISPFKVGGTVERPKNFSSNIYGIGYRFYDYEKKIVSIANTDHYTAIQTYRYVDDLNYNSSSNRPKDYFAITGQFFFDTTLKKPLWWNGSIWIDSNKNPADAKNQGTTAERPTGVQIGYVYKDTTLNKLIIWDGTEWINMDGTALG